MAGGRPARTRFPGEAFGLSPGAGLALTRDPPLDVAQIASLRAWSVRLRFAATALTYLATTVLTGCADAGLVGPAGDALQALGDAVARDAAEAAEAAATGADELDRQAALLMTGWSAAASPVPQAGGQR